MAYTYMIAFLIINSGICWGMKYTNLMELAYQSEINQIQTNSIIWLKDGSIETKVTFYLYTRGADEEVLKIDVDSLKNSHFDVNKDTKIVIHGYFDNKNRPMPKTIKNNYLSVADVNVIVVDWGKIAIGINYFYIAGQSSNVGYYLGELIDFLIMNGCNPKTFHLIGHSLGAHIAGYAGASLKYGPIARITGLDPAKPQFENAEASDRLDETDADFVDCIHTCGGLLGLYQPMGHVDFYPNGGRNLQPGCHFYDFGRCSHVRSHEYFAESILPNHIFSAFRCDSQEIKPDKCVGKEEKMGSYVSPSARGIFFVYTNDDDPYAEVHQ